MRGIDSAVVREWVRGVLAGVYEPEPDEEIWEWAERTLRIPATENEEMAGQLWSMKYSPYTKELFEWFKRPGKGWFWVKKSSQVGITMCVLIIICWMIVNRSGNIIYSIDSVNEARNISKTRLKKWITENRLLDEDGVQGSEDDLSNLTYYLKGLTVYLIGSNSAGSWANKSCVFVVLDELDKQLFIEGEGWTHKLADDRAKRPKNAKVLGFSTPGITGQISIKYDEGTQERCAVRFPCCGNFQVLEWDGFVFGDKEFRDLAGDYDLGVVAERAYFRCELCGGRLEERHKFEALQDYEVRVGNAKAKPGVRSLHLWDAYSNFVTFGQLAIEWIAAQGDPEAIASFFRNRRGMRYDYEGGTVSKDQLLELRGAYKRGECPIDPLFVGSATDMQKDCVKTVKFAFDRMGDMWILDWGADSNLNSMLGFADELIPSPVGDLVVERGFIDEGNDDIEVRQFHLAHLPRFWPVKGRGQDQMRQVVDTSESWLDGEQVLTYHVKDPAFKWQVLHSFQKGGGERRPGVKRILFPQDVDEDDAFLDELVNEVPVKVKNRFGKESWGWKTKGVNDYWDCIKYGKAMWMILAPALLAEVRGDAEDDAA